MQIIKLSYLENMAFLMKKNKDSQPEQKNKKTQEQWKMKESSMTEPVRKWLEKKSFTYYSEVPFPMAGYSFIDIVGIKDQDIICVELKVSLSEKAIYQANHNNLLTNDTYICILSKPKQTSVDRCKKLGIGILVLDENKEVKVLLEPTARNNIWSPMIKGLMETVANGWNQGVAGLPNMKGTGPAQDVLKLVREAREKNPKITWKELFDIIPHHYSTYRSMQQSIGKAEIREMVRKRKEAERTKEE